MAKSVRAAPTGIIPTRRKFGLNPPPVWIKPQLAKLVEKAPDGSDWLHELKLDGYRMLARLDAGRAQILTRRGNDWTDKYPTIAKAIAGLPAQNAYLDGELCGVLPDGRTAFNLIQNATDTGEGSLVFFLFDLLFLNGENLMSLPLVDRKARLEPLLKDAPNSLRYNDHQIGHGPEFHRLACERGLEGIVSKRTNGRYEPDRRTCAQDKMPQPGGIRRRWVERPRGQPTPDRVAAPGLLHTGRKAHLCRPSGHGDAGRRIGAVMATTSSLGDRQDAARDPAATRNPFRITVGALTGPLGAP